MAAKGQKNRKGAPLLTDFGLGGADVVTLNQARERALEYRRMANEVVKAAFAQVQMHPYGAHSIRKTLGQEMSDRELPLATQKAWSQNLGHENFTTTISSYLPVPDQLQGELIKGLDAE